MKHLVVHISIEDTIAIRTSDEKSMNSVINEHMANSKQVMPTAYDTSLDDPVNWINPNDKDERVSHFEWKSQQELDQVVSDSESHTGFSFGTPRNKCRTVSYSDHIRNLYNLSKYKKHKDIKSIKKQCKWRIEDAIYNFAENAVGDITGGLKSEKDDIIKKMKRQVKVGEGEQGKYHYILPSFFKLIMKLHQDYMDGDYDFKIVFRTLGDDIPGVMEEFNMFCNGKHKDYPDALFNGDIDTKSNKKTKDLRLPLKNIYHFYYGKNVDKTSKWDGGVIVRNTNDQCPVLQGLVDAYEQFTSISIGTIIINDHHHYWIANGSNHLVGRLFPVNENDKVTSQVFVSNNLEQWINTKSILEGNDRYRPSELIKKKWGHEVNTISAIQNEDYFVELLKDNINALYLE